jgi:uncharacterized protein
VWLVASPVFEWDPEKAARNLSNLGVSFDEASSILGDPLAATLLDRNHSIVAPRFTTMGVTPAQRLLVVNHTDRSDPGSNHQRSRRNASRKEAV